MRGLRIQFRENGTSREGRSGCSIRSPLAKACTRARTHAVGRTEAFMLADTSLCAKTLKTHVRLWADCWPPRWIWRRSRYKRLLSTAGP